jgi:hypothetical protein
MRIAAFIRGSVDVVRVEPLMDAKVREAGKPRIPADKRGLFSGH